MKVLLDHSNPFRLAHGGVQVQIEQTKLALERAQLEVEFVRWWDDQQRGDIIHYFGSIPNGYLRLARRKRIPVVLTSFFSSTCNRSDWRLGLQGILVRSLLAFPVAESLKAQLQWRAYRDASHLIVGLEAERKVLGTVYGVPASRISVVPLGLDDICLRIDRTSPPDDRLISVGTICDVKRSIELGRLARRANVPILFVGDPYSVGDPYWKEFERLIDGKAVFHQRHVSSRTHMMELLTSARGFVLYSSYENWSLAAHEAAACGLPLLLPDQKWSRECFSNRSSYFGADSGDHAEALKKFYVSSQNAILPVWKSESWDEVAHRLIDIYRATAASQKDSLL